MNKDIKDRWVTALRSGEYKQCKGVLMEKEPRAYCCLGVLSLLADLPTEDHEEDFNSLMSVDDILDAVVSPHEQNTLICMNDDFGKDFNEIADYIEENL